MLKLIKYLFFILLINSCVETPELDYTNNLDGEYLILSEGLLGQNNSKLSLLNLKDSIINNNYFEQNNNELLGDNANDMIIVNDYIYIIISQSNLLVKLNKSNGKLISKYNFQKNRFIKRIYFDKFIYISDLLNNSLLKLNPDNLEIISEIQVGPGPEGISSNDNFIFVANSAVGQFKDNEAGARTVSIIDKSTFTELKQIYIGPNTTDVKYSNNYLIASYSNFHWQDNIGAFILYDLNNNIAIDSIPTEITSKTILYNNKIYFINSLGLNSLDLNNLTIQIHILNNSTNIWYSFNIIDDLFFILDAKNHQVPGELIIFDNKNKIANFTTGLNPNTILKIK